MTLGATGKIYFIGAGPGALDLLTVRAHRIIQQADLILYADSLVNPEIATLAKQGAEVRGTASLALDEIVDLIVSAASVGRTVARVHSGDPSIFGAIREQMVALDAAGLGYEVVPGVSSLFGAAAALGVELTVPEVSQTVIICRMAGRTPVPHQERLRDLASHRATMAIFLSSGLIDKAVAELLAGGFPPETPAAVVYRASWPEQQIIRAPLADVAQAMREAGITRQALVLVGEALDFPSHRAADRARFQNSPELTPVSRLYDPGFGHGYRSKRQKGQD